MAGRKIDDPACGFLNGNSDGRTDGSEAGMEEEMDCGIATECGKFALGERKHQS